MIKFFYFYFRFKTGNLFSMPYEHFFHLSIRCPETATKFSTAKVVHKDNSVFISIVRGYKVASFMMSQWHNNAYKKISFEFSMNVTVIIYF